MSSSQLVTSGDNTENVEAANTVTLNLPAQDCTVLQVSGTIYCVSSNTGWFTINSATNGVVTSSTTSTATTNVLVPHTLISSTASSVFVSGTYYTATCSSYSEGEINWRAVHQHARPVKKSTRNAIKRALRLMTGLGFEEDARIFLNGDVVEVAHPDSLLKFVISKYDRSLISRTEYPGYSTPFKLELHTKCGIKIANLCVYMDKTPVLDQVLGVAMFIKSGDEELILSKANWSSLTRDMETRQILALEYPYLEEKLRLQETPINNVQYVPDAGNYFVQGTLQ